MHEALGDVAFGHFRMDGRRRALLANGKIVALHARAFDVLEYLVAHRDSVLTRDEITTAVWRGTAIGDNNLTVQISALRRALSQHGGDGLIVNFPGRGYRFVGDVTVTRPPQPADNPQANGSAAGVAPAMSLPSVVPDSWDITAVPPENVGAALAIASAGQQKPRRRSTLALPAVACGLVLAASAGLAPRLWRPPAPPPRLSVAVLPFRDLTADPHETYLADAITDDLDTELARALKMQVIARDSAVNVAQRHLSLKQINHELGVRYVLDGSLQKTEAGYTINPHLNDAQTGLQLWSVPFTVTKDHFGDARTVIVRRIASELGYGLDALESRLASEQRPDNPDALDLYYQASALLDTAVSTQNLQAAAALLQAAIDKQGDFVDALAKLGWVLLRKAQSDPHVDSQRDRQRAHLAIHRALDKDHDNAAVLAAYAFELEQGGDYPAAEYEAGEALKWTGSNLQAQTVLANCAWEQGHFGDAASALAAMELIDPVSENHRGRQLLKSYLAILRGEAPEAVAMLSRFLADHPDADRSADPMQPPEYASILLIAAYGLSNQWDKAKSQYIAYDRKYPHRSVWRISAFDSHAISTSPQVQTVLAALHTAGMPAFADEAPVSGAVCTADYNDFTPTPDHLPPGGQTIQTRDMIAHFRNKDDVLVIDVGLGVSAYPRARWADHGEPLEDVYAFADQLLQARTQGETRLPVIIMDNGPFGCAGYLTATHLLSEHIPNVVWYRGGEESWASAGMPSIDYRKY